ncbi:MAG: putative porin [Parachlamydiaceae bacterium]
MKFLRYVLFGTVVLGMNLLSAEQFYEHHEDHGHQYNEQHEEHHGFNEHHEKHGGERDYNYFSRFDEKDWSALRELLADKQAEKKKVQDEEDDDVHISGDIRANFSNASITDRKIVGWKPFQAGFEEKEKAYLDQLKEHKKTGKEVTLAPVERNETNSFPVHKRDRDYKKDANTELNLRFDYKCTKVWVSAQLQYENDMGIKDFGLADCDKKCLGGFFGGGDADGLTLRKAFIGYNIVCNSCYKLDVELGRRGNLYNVFDSKVQFVSRFDGVLLKLSSQLDGIDCYLNTAGFVIDRRKDHFGWVAETGVFKVANSDLDLKYSFIWWPKKGKNRCGVRNPKAFEYGVSQITAIYQFDPRLTWCKSIQGYGAFLVNHFTYHSDPRENNKTTNFFDRKRVNYAAAGLKYPRYPSANLGWYVGFQLGSNVKNKGDWMIDFRYQWVQAKVIPDGDNSGIGLGARSGRFNCDLGGNTNYKGWRIEALYALTKCLQLDTTFEHASTIDKIFGGPRNKNKFEFEVIYTF